nr:hypothetical protein [Tanacetum cinerariifolium]
MRKNISISNMKKFIVEESRETRYDLYGFKDLSMVFIVCGEESTYLLYYGTTDTLRVSYTEYINTPSWNRHAFYNNDEDDDEEYTIAITLVLPTEEPDNSLSMGDEHLSTILEMESDEVIKSSVEDLVSILNYVETSPPHYELISFEEVKDFHPKDGELEDDVVREKLSKINLLIAKIKALNANPTPSFNFVLKSPIPIKDGDSFLEKFQTTPKLKTFKFDIEEKNSSSTTIHADISLLDLECFYFKSEPDRGDLTSIIDPGIRKNVSSTTNVNLPFEDDQSPLFAYVV